MSTTRAALVGLLVASTVMFAVGVVAERSSADTHAEPATANAREVAGERAGAREEGEGSAAGEASHDEGAADETRSDENEAVLGVDVESTPLIVLAVLVGLALAGLAAIRFGRRPGVLIAIALIALAWAALDVREVAHQLDESRTAIAVIAIVVAALHLAVALLAGTMAARERQLDGGSPGRPGTIPA